MSMHEYPIASHGAFYVDGEAATYIQLALAKEGKGNRPFTEAMKAMPREELFTQAKAGAFAVFGYGEIDNIKNEVLFDAVLSCPRFEGNVSTIYEAHEYTENPIDKDFDEATICFLECANSMSLFEKAYSSVGHLVAEYKYRLKECDFPDDFDWYAHIVDVEGCTYD